MRICDKFFKIPDELSGEDVYNTLYIFNDEEEAIDYILNNYSIDKESFILELHEEDSLRQEFGKENYLRTASISLSLYLQELMNGEYILWEAY